MESEDKDICYALKRYTYDYHEWGDVFAVSFDEQDLLNYFVDDLEDTYDDRELVSLEEHESLASMEEAHWVIEPIKYL